MKPNNFPLRPNLDGTEELYTQTNNVPQKFILEETKKYSNVIEVTYSELVTLATDSKLIAGSHYIITDYQTCYDQPDYDILDVAITDPSIYRTTAIDPIIVMATSETTLAPDAYQPSYPNDKIKYDISYKLTETGNPAFGRITERIDENNNRTDYDHRTILFKRYASFSYIDQPAQTGTLEIQSGGLVVGNGTTFTNLSVGNIIAIPNSNEIYYEIINIVDNVTMYISGNTVSTTLPLQEFYIAVSDGFLSYKQTNITSNPPKELLTFNGINIFNNYIGNYANFYTLGNSDFLLANNVFVVDNLLANTFGDFTFNNTFNSFNISSNVTKSIFSTNIIILFFNGNGIEEYFSNNYIKANFDSNLIGKSFVENQIFAEFANNKIGDSYNNNTITGQFNDNRVENNFEGNLITGTCYDNAIKNNFISNIIGTNFFLNDIGNNFLSNDIGDNFIGNNINNNFINNTIGNNFGFLNSGGGVTYGNKIGNNFTDNTIGVSFYNNLINNNFTGNTIGNSFSDNEINKDFNDNIIANKFRYNVLNAIMLSCTIVTEFRLNRIETSAFYYDFTLSTHVYANYNCRIFLSNNTNTYLEYFAGTTATYVSPTA